MLLAALLTKAGNLYLRPIPSEDAEDAGQGTTQTTPGEQPTAPPQADRSIANGPPVASLGRKMLAAVGKDDRVPVPAPGYPYTAVGFLTVDNNARGCTGTLIGRRSVLTGGHW
jgi:V8-like Glu-specific endopeptidase